ncbi:prostaglandin F2 receptor negative regulator-like [Onychostoma macrolepis]|uniref:prostaglandin F2 receptor negative regulator-like n=1 Tax=Onychostoma macrolepis TaxID=369639 RepID=UPI002729BF54|nr:prostaglandin F2 receptor negative regulator-like [Onychostoma macrolepis]
MWSGYSSGMVPHLPSPIVMSSFTLAPSVPPGIVNPMAAVGFLVPLALPWSVITLTLPWTYGSSSVTCPSTRQFPPSALTWFSVAPLPPQSSGALAPPQSFSAEALPWSPGPSVSPVSTAFQLQLGLHFPHCLKSIVPWFCLARLHHGSSLGSAMGLRTGTSVWGSSAFRLAASTFISTLAPAASVFTQLSLCPGSGCPASRLCVPNLSHLPLLDLLSHNVLFWLVVRGPSGPLVAPLGSSVVLPCYVDELLLMQGLEVEWRRTDSETLVHLYQDGESRAESQQQDYHDRAHFFTDQIQHGNFSLRLDNLTAEDEGRYTCTVHSQQDSGEIVVEIKYLERLLVSGSDESISASVGEDVTLNCSVDSHIAPEHIEEVSWRKTDGYILVLLYQNNETLSDSSDERYRDRAEFFTAEIPKGNFSLRLKSIRTEDKGVYMCQVFAGGLSANATVELEQLGFSVSHIMVLILCISASGSALLLYWLIYCRPHNEGIYQQQRY